MREAEFILVGAGAGLSAAAGLTYNGKRFTDHFGEFIEKYGSAYMTDMYAAGFYLFPSQEEERGITDCNVLPVSPIDNRLVLWRGDITTLRVDAIVNAANSALRGCFVPCHFCVDNIIHSVSGIQLRLACDKLMTEQGYDEPTGKAKITPAFNLPSSYVIHTVGPIVSGVLTEKHCEQLADCYRSCLELAAGSGLKSIAFCCISTGEFHFPQERAAEIAVQTVTDFLRTYAGIEKVIFNVFKQEDHDIYKRLLG